MLIVMQRCCARNAGSLESWWELTSYGRVTAIGVLVEPTKLAERRRKGDLLKIVEKMGLQVVEVLGKNMFRLG